MTWSSKRDDVADLGISEWAPSRSSERKTRRTLIRRITVLALRLFEVKERWWDLKLEISEEIEIRELIRVLGEVHSQGFIAGKLNARRLSSSELCIIEGFFFG